MNKLFQLQSTDIVKKKIIVLNFEYLLYDCQVNEEIQILFTLYTQSFFDLQTIGYQGTEERYHKLVYLSKKRDFLPPPPPWYINSLRELYM